MIASPVIVRQPPLGRRSSGFVCVTVQQKNKMTREQRLGETLRKIIAVPTDTMITLDIPLLLTKLSQLPASPGTTAGNKAPSDTEQEPDA